MEQKGNEFKALQVLHKAMMLGVLLATTILIFLVVRRGGSQVSPSLERALQVVALVMAVGGPAAGFVLFKKRLQTIQPMDTAPGRMLVYRGAAIIRWASIEAPAFFAVICFKMTGNYAFLALALALLFIFAAVRPSTQIVTFQLQLTEAEVRQLQGISE